MVETLTVNLGERNYPIQFGADTAPLAVAEVARLTAAGRKIAVVTDAHVREAQGAALAAMFGSAPTLVVEPGEGAKSIAGLERVLDFLASHKLDRSGALFAVGGGVIGDLGGYGAASWLRGIDYYQVPTTLLSMVDSSVGGKTGINLKAGKNLAGAFHQPRGVFISTGLLATLPPREFAAGAAEIIKYGLLGDPALFAQLEQTPLRPVSHDTAHHDQPGSGRRQEAVARPPQASVSGSAHTDPSYLPSVIRRCCALKARIVEADERETAKEGGRALLNLGHTFGHAIENAAGYGEYLHGEAVAIGLCAAARLSARLGYIGAAEVDRVDRVVAAHALPVHLRSPLSYATLHAAMTRDKKVRAGGLRFVVLKTLGEAATQSDIPPDLIEATFREVGAAD